MLTRPRCPLNYSFVYSYAGIQLPGTVACCPCEPFDPNKAYDSVQQQMMYEM
jgi:hypothetical protein